MEQIPTPLEILSNQHPTRRTIPSAAGNIGICGRWSGKYICAFWQTLCIGQALGISSWISRDSRIKPIRRLQLGPVCCLSQNFGLLCQRMNTDIEATDTGTVSTNIRQIGSRSSSITAGIDLSRHGDSFFLSRNPLSQGFQSKWHHPASPRGD
eukprot:9879529-Ditylum_brightwellii.AAC.1